MANTLEIVIKATDKASKEIGSVAKGVQGLCGVASAAMKGIAIAGSAAVTAVGAVGAAIGKLAVDAIPLQGIEAAFEGISGASDEMLDALRRGSLGMVTDRELMRNYNQAAQLVSKTFADQLPDAMKYLAKVSAATGQDMGYMLDSLTKGVGRLSPMILDNLGIQVSLEEATAEAAEMFGVEADALSKTQLQAGMMNVVMRALERNTADMPEIASTAAQRWAALGTTFKNVKDQIGLAFIPVLERGMGAVEMFVNDKLPGILTWFTDKFAPGVGEAIDRAAQFVKNLASGERFNVAIRELLAGVLAPEDIEKIVDVSRWVEGFTNAIKAGDWSKAGGMIWEQIVIGMGKVKISADAFSDMMRKTVAGGLGLQEYVWDEFGNLTKGDTSWNAIGREIMLRIAEGMVKATNALLGIVEDPEVITTMNSVGRGLGNLVGEGLAGLFGLSGSKPQTDTETAISGMMVRVRDNIAQILRNIGREIGWQIAAGIAEGITGTAPEQAVQNAIETTLENADPGPSFLQQLGASYGQWYASLPDWFTGGTGWLEGTAPTQTIGPRPEDAYNFGTRGGGAVPQGYSGPTLQGPAQQMLDSWLYNSMNGPAMTTSIGNMPQAIDLATVPDLVDDWTEAIVVEVQRRRRVAESEARQRADAPVRDVNITINAPSGSGADIEIGVLRGLRAAGVGIR